MNDTDINDRPKWLLELENRKRKPRLAHEAGAGAPCVLCKATCPGLDLHFWRKICKNCKCSKGDHDVDDEDFPQFDLLFGSSRKYKKKPILLHINNGKEHTEEEAFEWIPPDATKELAIDYMKALPIEKLPIKGSTGAALRRQLLQKQLPRHDIDYKTCDKLTDQEKKEFEKYLENIKKYVGQGTVTKILSAHPFDGSLVTPVNATDMQHFSPQHKANIPPTFIQLRRPSCFASNSLHKKNLCETVDVQEFPIPLKTSSNCNIKDIPISETYDIISSNGNVVKSETIKNDVYNKGMQQNDSKKISNSNQNIAKGVSTTENLKYLNDATLTNIYSEATPWNSSECYKQAHKNMVKNPSTTLLNSKLMKDNADVTESILADILLPSNTLRTNDIIRSTLDEKGLMYIREKLTNKYSKQENQGQIYNAPNFARSLDSTSSLHQNNDLTSHGLNTSTSINKETDKTAITATMKNPTEMLIPLQDKLQISEPIKGEKEIINFNPEIVQSEPLDTAAGINTGNLKENVLPISLKVVENAIFTPSSSSKTHLQSYNMNNYQAKINNFITPSNTIHSIKLQAQIFPHETAAKTKQSEQNSPSNIENLKGAMEKLTIDAIKSQKCHKCEEEVKVGDVAIIMEKAKNAAWHPGCFVCNMCNELLVDLVYFYYKNKLYCGRDLATLLGIPRCFACDELIFVREYTVAEGHNYHVKHFCCWECDIPLAGKQYITENDRPLCLLCYQKTYAKTCNMCEKIIAADQQGVAVKDLNFHATETCFCCYICNKSLLNGKFAVKETKIFCSKECISKFLYPRTK